MEFLITITVKSDPEKNIPDWGLGPGVLGTAIVDFNTLDELPDQDSIDSWYFWQAMKEKKSEVVDSLIDVSVIKIKE